MKNPIATRFCPLLQLINGQVRIALVVMILGFVGASGICHADEIAVLPGTGGQTNDGWNGNGSTTIGYQFTVNWYPMVVEPFPFHPSFVCPPVPGNTAISSAWHIPEAPTNPRIITTSAIRTCPLINCKRGQKRVAMGFFMAGRFL